MSNMKCPFCQSEIAFWGMNMFYCPHCANTKFCRGNKELWQELIRTRKALDVAKKENEDKQAVLNCVVDMIKTLNQKYTLIMGKDVIKETVRLLEQKDVK